MRGFSTLVVLAALAGNAQADFKAGLDAWNSGDYKSAFDQFKQAAEQGDSRAQFYVGEAFNKGRGVVQDYAEAVTWYRKAAEQNDTEAQDTLCPMYFFGQSTVSQDYAEAVKFCAPAGKHGKANSAYLGGVSLRIRQRHQRRPCASCRFVSGGCRRRQPGCAGSARAYVFLRPGRDAGLRGSGQMEPQSGRPGPRVPAIPDGLCLRLRQRRAEGHGGSRQLVSQSGRAGRQPGHELARLFVLARHRRDEGRSTVGEVVFAGGGQG